MVTPGKLLTLVAVTGVWGMGLLWAQEDNVPPSAQASSGVSRATTVRSTNGVASVTLASEGSMTLASEDSLQPVGTFEQARIVTTVPVVPMPGLPGPAVVWTQNGNQTEHELQIAMAQYRDAKDDAARGKAREKVAADLSKIYDEHLANHEKQIQELEDRLVKLREQLERRREAKDRMVELKLEMVLSQAEGLGWPDADGRSPFEVSGFSSPRLGIQAPFTRPAASFPTAPSAPGSSGLGVIGEASLLRSPAAPVNSTAPAAPTPPPRSSNQPSTR